MSLLYLHEHIFCKEYLDPKVAAFTVYRFKKGEKLPDKIMEYTAIIFLLEGKILTNCGSFLDSEVHPGCVFLIPNGVAISGIALEDTVALRCILNMEGRLCNRYSLETLKKYVDVDTIDYNLELLPIRDRLREFAESLIHCIDDGLGCRHFHRSKQEELLLLLRGYYTKEELARFFYPILCSDWNMNSFVLNHYKEASNVGELAEKANLSLVTFNRRFKKAFGESAARWLEKRRAEAILREIQLTQKSFSEIAEEFYFSSPAYFTTFCKRCYGKTPKELRSSYTSKQLSVK